VLNSHERSAQCGCRQTDLIHHPATIDEPQKNPIRDCINPDVNGFTLRNADANDNGAVS
jgi:hypothetical protein